MDLTSLEHINQPPCISYYSLCPSPPATSMADYFLHLHYVSAEYRLHMKGKQLSWQRSLDQPILLAELQRFHNSIAPSHLAYICLAMYYPRGLFQATIQ